MYNKKIQIAGFYFVLPTLIIYGIFLIYPMITAFHYSFFKWNLLSEKKYVGLSNFAKMINDKRFWNSYITTFHFTLISIVLIIILSFILALILEKSFKFKNFQESQKFINKVGEIAENEKHHPDIMFGWGYATIQIFTHAIKGLAESDFILAAKIDKINI